MPGRCNDGGALGGRSRSRTKTRMTVLLTAQDSVTVLVVDDSDDQRVLLTRYFERAGCAVISVSSAEDAVLAYESENTNFDLAVIDLMLSGMNGWDFSAQLRVARPGCVIAIASVLDPIDYPECDVALPKPFTGADVLQVLREHVPRWKKP